MTEFGRHKCPNCGNFMQKMGSLGETWKEGEKVWDLAHTGLGTTANSTTSDSNYAGVTCPLQGSSYRLINLVPYECPVCHFAESYRE